MKTCAFCLRAATMSGEHLWGAWISRLYGEPTRLYDLKTRLSDGRYRNWKSKSADLKAHVVCEPCNNTWMSDLEAEASTTLANMIRWASPVSLLPPGIASIATFLFKTAVVADHTRPKHRPFFSHSARRQFSASLEIPPGVQMWIASFGHNHPCGRFTTHYAKIHSSHLKGFELYIFTYVAGFVALQLTASRWTSIAKQPHFFPLLTQNDAWNRASVPLWPSKGMPIGWPPTEHLNDNSLKFFAERWAKLRLGSH